MVDLHVHSTRSDGTYTPSQLVDYAIAKGLSAFALTDHDSVDGLDEAIGYAAEEPAAPEVVPGVELSSEYQGLDIHVVGLFINARNAGFQKYLRDFVDSRDARNEKMCTLLRGTGMDITYAELQRVFPNSVITRAHYAKYMLERGYVKSRAEAFERYLGDHCPCYVSREKVTPAQAVSLILDADGVPILAHPILYHMSDARLDKLVAELKDAGLMGIEAIYSTYQACEERQIRVLAEKYDLLISGGSDFHGENKPGLDLGTGYGKLFVPDEVLERIRQAHDSRR